VMHDLISADRCYFMKSDPSRSSVIFIGPPRDMKGVRKKGKNKEKKGSLCEKIKGGFWFQLWPRGVRPLVGFSFTVYALFIVVKVR